MKTTEELVLDIVRSVVSAKVKGMVTLDAKLTGDLSMDSIQLVGLTVQLGAQMRFDPLSSDADWSSISTVRDVVKVVSQSSSKE